MFEATIMNNIVDYKPKWLKEFGTIEAIVSKGGIASIKLPKSSNIFVGEILEIWKNPSFLILSRSFEGIQHKDPINCPPIDNYPWFKRRWGVVISLSERSAEILLLGNHSEIKPGMYWHSTGEVHDSYVEK